MASILVVDDEMGIRELLFEILDDEGHTVIKAANAAEAHQMRRKHDLDLVLLDIWMPDADGVSVLREWAAEQLLTIPVIMMSGHATIDTAVEAMRVGAIDYMEKPITLQKLLSTVDKVLREAKKNAPLVSKAAKSPTPIPSAPLDFDLLMADLDNLPTQNISTNSLLDPQQSFSRDLSFINLDQPLRQAREHFERTYLEHLMRRTGKSMSRLAELSGLERTHLYRKLRNIGLALPRGRRDDSE